MCCIQTPFEKVDLPKNFQNGILRRENRIHQFCSWCSIKRLPSSASSLLNHTRKEQFPYERPIVPPSNWRWIRGKTRQTCTMLISLCFLLLIWWENGKFNRCVYIWRLCSKTKTLSRTIWKINLQIMMKMVSCSLLLLCVIDGSRSLMALNLWVLLLHCFFMLPRSYRSFVMRIGEFNGTHWCMHTYFMHSYSYCISSIHTQWERSTHAECIHI